MGYESKLYVVQEFNNGHPMENYDTGEIYKTEDGTPKHWAQVIATFDLCKCGYLVDIFSDEAACLFYADDGDTLITEDGYGKPLRSAPICKVIRWLEKNHDDWWRMQMAYESLKALAKFGGVGLKVYHYGY